MSKVRNPPKGELDRMTLSELLRDARCPDPVRKLVQCVQDPDGAAMLQALDTLAERAIGHSADLDDLGREWTTLVRDRENAMLSLIYWARAVSTLG